MTRLRGAVAGAAALILLVGCGQSDAHQAAKKAAAEASASVAASASAEAEAQAEAEAEAERKAKEQAQRKRAWKACAVDTRRLHDTLTEIDSRLSIGRSNQEFGDMVGDAQVAYDRTPFKGMKTKCTFNVGIALEASLNHYIRAYNAWQRCIEDYDCEVEGPVLQNLRSLWGKAGQALGKVERVLRTPGSYDRAKDLV